MANLLEIFATFARLSSISFGGGPSMIPIFQSEVVDAKEWVTDADFRQALAIGYSLPGPIAPKMAFWTGLQIAGFPGALVAVIGVELPSLAFFYILTRFFFTDMSNNSVMAGATRGASIGVVGLLIYIAYDQAFKVFARDTGGNWLEGISKHPEWIIVVVTVVVLSLWRPTLMVPLSLIGSAIFGAIFLR